MRARTKPPGQKRLSYGSLTSVTQSGPMWDSCLQMEKGCLENMFLDKFTLHFETLRFISAMMGGDAG